MKTALNVALIAGLIVSAPYVGLYASVGLYLLIHMIVLNIRPVVAASVAAASTLVMYGFFGMLLGVEMRGVLLF